MSPKLSCYIMLKLLFVMLRERRRQSKLGIEIVFSVFVENEPQTLAEKRQQEGERSRSTRLAIMYILFSIETFIVVKFGQKC